MGWVSAIADCNHQLLISAIKITCIPAIYFMFPDHQRWLNSVTLSLCLSFSRHRESLYNILKCLQTDKFSHGKRPLFFLTVGVIIIVGTQILTRV